MEIRKINLEDASNFLNFFKQILLETDMLASSASDYNLTINDERSFIAKISADELFIIALEDNKIVGNLSLHKVSKIEKLKHNYSVGIAVLKDYQNQGIGNLLFQELFKHIKEYNITNIFLEVRSDNLNAKHLYEKYGFKKIGTAKDYFKVANKLYDLDYYQYLEYDKESLYQEALTILPSLLANNHFISNMANFATFMWDYIPDINWLGFYLNDSNKLVLGPFKGKVACTNIEYTKGVCGHCYQTDDTIVVADVHKFKSHIACDSASNSEIVIPIHKNGQIFALLDIDSPYFNRFDEVDKKYLEQIVKILEESLRN